MEIIRGDNKSFKFQRKNSGGEVITVAADEIYFTVKKNINYTECVLQKRLSNNGIVFNNEDYYYRFEILPEDTDDLQYGSYVYDIERIVSGNKKTISKGNFTISTEVTCLRNEVE